MYINSIFTFKKLEAEEENKQTFKIDETHILITRI